MAGHDQRDNPVGTVSAPALAAYERSLWHLVGFYGDPVAALDATIAADPGWALAKVAKADFLLSLTEPVLVPQARALLDDAAQIGGANERERAHLAAARSAAAGRFREAGERWDRIALDHPRDLLAILFGHLFDFYRGDARSLRGRIARVLPEWDAGDPLYPYLLGMHAFGLEECNLYPQAEACGRDALERDPRGPWAIHAVAHVMEMQGRHEEGLAWLAGREPDWAVDNGLHVHLWWHRALFHLETLDTAGALALYDARIAPPAALVNLNWLDAAAMLWRLRLLGVETTSRFAALAVAWADPVGHAGWYAFNDVHALLACAGSGDLARARALLDVARTHAAGTGDNAAMATEVGLPLMEGLLDFVRGDAAGAIRRLYPLRGLAHRFGGSHAQRDLLDQTLLAAAAQPGGDRALGRALLNERLLAKPRTPLTAHWAARLA
jgi:tetratricopeptide (TPR) repeat protein